ncbi:MAG: cytochrome c, partial [Proteobacteria bacterium]|nr:cytochrome c [Pseudomonadota bacterium]
FWKRRHGDKQLKRLANMISGFSDRWWILGLGILMSVIWLTPIHHGKAAEDGEEIFQSYCAACHTIGKGRLVGPDLAGVTLRREESWLIRQIKEPDALIAENDPIALQLLQEADDVEMPPLELSDEEITAVIAYLKSTEQQTSVETGIPSLFIPTILLSLFVLFLLTFLGIRAGSKKVDVR